MSQVELQLPPEAAFVGLARLVVVAAARNAGMDETRREDLRIAVSEATTNAITARQRAGASTPVTLRFGAMEGVFQVTVADLGGGVDPPPEDVERREWSVEGGLGITLIRGLADDVRYIRESGTRVDLRFSLSLNGRSDLPERASTSTSS